MNAPGESAAFVYILSNPQKALNVGYSTHFKNRVNGHKRGVLEHRRGKVRRPYTATRKIDPLVYFEHSPASKRHEHENGS